MVKMHEVAIDVPEEYYAPIGELITRWGQLEYLMHELTWRCLGIDNKQGRVLTIGTSFKAVRGYLTTATKRWVLNKTEQQAINSIVRHARKLHIERNVLAHGSWQHPAEDGGDVYLHYMHESEERLLPRAKKRTPEDIRGIASSIREQCMRTKKLIARIEARQQSSQERSARRRPLDT